MNQFVLIIIAVKSRFAALNEIFGIERFLAQDKFYKVLFLPLQPVIEFERSMMDAILFFELS